MKNLISKKAVIISLALAALIFSGAFYFFNYTKSGALIIMGSAYDKQRPLIVHNIGAGPKINDVLMKWKITGHFRYFGSEVETL